MNFRPGVNALRLCGGMLAAASLCFVWPHAATAVALLLAAGLGLGCADYLRLRRALGQISVRRKLPACAARGSPFTLELTLRNAASVPCCGTVRDILPAEAEPRVLQEDFTLAAQGQAQVRRELVLPVRGLHRFPETWVRVCGAFRILEMQKRMACAGALKVLPDHAVSREGLANPVLAESAVVEQLSRTHARGTGMEFRSLGEFRTGDDPRRLDARATARQNHPVVRQYQWEQHREVMIVLDCGRLMGALAARGTKLDCAVDSALMLAHTALARGDRCGLAAFDDQVLRYLPPQAGKPSYHILMESVYNAQSRWRESNFSALFSALQTRQSKRALIAVLSDLPGHETSAGYRSALAALARRHVVVFVAVKTPALGDYLRAETADMNDAAKKAVVLRILDERQQALHSLSRSGIHVLDAEPGEITIPLINRYAEIRERNLL